MDAGLELELRVRASANDFEDDLFEAALIRSTSGQLFGLPAVTLCVTQVHLVEIAGEERGVVPFGELLRFGEALLDVTKRADGLDDRGERRELLTDLADAVAIGCCLGRADGALELLVATLDALESAA